MLDFILVKRLKFWLQKEHPQLIKLEGAWRFWKTNLGLSVYPALSLKKKKKQELKKTYETEKEKFFKFKPKKKNRF